MIWPRPQSISNADSGGVQRPRRRHMVLAAACVCLAAGLLPLGEPRPAGAAAASVSIDRLWGPTRYETAVAIAEEYLDTAAPGGTRANSAILTSGLDQHFGFALAAPALSRRLGAPLLLTEPDHLPDAVAELLRERRIAQVTIIGGPDVVSADVAQALNDAGVTDVERVGDGDAYSTAAAVARLTGTPVGRPGRYRSLGRTAIVATGEVFADALAASPLAYRGQHPILLTPRASLHAEVSGFLTSSETAHVLIVGGPAAVNDDVETAIEALGMRVTRLYGADRFATALRIAEELLGPEAPYSCFDGSALGLAHGRKSADAIVSGPLLGELCAPLVLTEQARLPSTVRDFLRSDEFVSGDARAHLEITILGGEQAVSASTVRTARDAATLRPITARIEGLEGRCFFRVTFNEPVLTEDAENVRNYRIDGDTIDPPDAVAQGGEGRTTTEIMLTFDSAGQPSQGAVPVACTTPLAVGEEIEIIGGLIGAEGSQRKVERTTSIVRQDRNYPRLEVSAFADVATVWVEADEPLRLATGEVEFVRRSSSCTPSTVTATTFATVTLGAVRFEVDVPTELGGSLCSGDRVTVLAGAVRDLAGNPNHSRAVTARADTVPPRVTRVTVSEPVPRESATIGVDGSEDGLRLRDVLVIEAESDGDAAGAAGNEWSLEVELESSWDAERASVISVSGGRQRITIRAPQDRILGDVAADLNANETFRKHFEAKLEGIRRSDDVTFDDESGPTLFLGGLSTVDLTVQWSEPILDCDASVGAVTPRDLEIDVDGDGDYEFSLDGVGAARFGVRFVNAPDGNPAIVAGAASCDDAPTVDAGTLVARLESDDLEALPTRRSRLFVNAGAATDRSGNTAQDRRVSGFARP